MSDDAIKAEAIGINPTSVITFMGDNDDDKSWIMKLSRDKGIEFNKETYTEASPDEFALAVIEILEHCFDVTFNRKEPPYKRGDK